MPRAPVTIVEGRADDVLASCDVVVTASGTATVQAAIHECPMVIVYRVAPLTYALGRRLVHLDTFGMVNLVAGERVAAGVDPGRIHARGRRPRSGPPADRCRPAGADRGRPPLREGEAGGRRGHRAGGRRRARGGAGRRLRPVDGLTLSGTHVTVQSWLEIQSLRRWPLCCWRPRPRPSRRSSFPPISMNWPARPSRSCTVASWTSGANGRTAGVESRPS